MIIWSGHGIFIPILLVIGWLGGSLLGGLAGGFASGGNGGAMAGMTLLGGSVGPACLAWLYALTIGKTQERTLLDPATRRPVRLRKRHTFFFIPAFAWAVIASGVAVVRAGMGVVAWQRGADWTVQTRGPGAAELSNAEKLITSQRHGILHGNTEEARKMAMAFSNVAKELRDVAIEIGESSPVSLSGGNFLTYCQVSEHGTVFLVHVPELRKFTTEAKDTMASVAWAAAQMVVASQEPAPRNLAVGVRGMLLYDKIMIGKRVTGFKSKLDEGIVSRHESSDSEVLHPFFSSPALPVTLAGPGEKSVADSAAKRSAPAVRGTPQRAQPAASVQAPAPVTPSMTTAAAPATPEAVTPVARTPIPPLPPMVISTVSAASVLPTPLREWKSSDGRPMRAILVRFTDADGAQAEFKREDGTVFNIEVAKFSVEDRIEMLRIFTASTTPPKP